MLGQGWSRPWDLQAEPCSQMDTVQLTVLYTGGFCTPLVGRNPQGDDEGVPSAVWCCWKDTTPNLTHGAQQWEKGDC